MEEEKLNEMEEKLKILVLDDDEVERIAVCCALLKSGFQVEISEASDGKSALNNVVSHSYDCIFLDDRLRDQDGLALITKLRSLEIQSPVIVLTEQAEEKDKQLAFEFMNAGATDYLIKSRLSPEFIAQVMRNAIRVDRAEKLVALATKQLEESRELLSHKEQELESQRQQIELQNLKLIEASRLKSQFLATMSHELRTPMNAIIGFSQLLLRPQCGELTNHQRGMVDRILNNSKHLLMLLNEILDFSKLEAGHLNVKPEIFDLPKIVNATVAEMLSLAKAKNLSVEVEINLQNPMVFNDPMRVRQILVNLLSNAIKFTESSGRVAVETRELSENRLFIAVSDTGIGIAPENIKHIFEAFRQVDQSTTRRYSGTGLGLPIVKALVQMMGGTITVDSKLGEGSDFQIELPRRISSSKYQIKTQTDPATHALKKKSQKHQETTHIASKMTINERMNS